MKKILTKTNISLLLVALCVMLFCGALAISNLTSNKPFATAYEAGSSATLKGSVLSGYESDFLTWNQYLQYDITNLILTNDASKIPSNPAQTFDPSESLDGSLTAYVVKNGDVYDCIIYGNVETIKAPVISNFLFSGYTHTLGTTQTKLVTLESITFDCNFDTSDVTHMWYMFSQLPSLKTLDLSGFNTSNVISMSAMFYQTSALTTLDLSSFDTKKVESFDEMFDQCESLVSVNLSSFDTTNTTRMGSMFAFCKSLVSLDLKNFDTTNVNDMYGMFHNCESLTNLDISSFNTSLVTRMSWMFWGCKSLKNIDVRHFNTSQVTDMSYMFADCQSVTDLDLSNFDTTNVTMLNTMFQNCKSLTNLDISSFVITSNQQWLYNMFDGCMSLKSLNLKHFTTNSITNFEEMFRNCSSLETLDISSFVISSSANINEMFEGATRLKTIYAPADCGASISIIKTFVEEGTTTEYNTLSSDTNGKTLVYNPSSVTLMSSFKNSLVSYTITKLTITNNSSSIPSNYVEKIDVSEIQDGYLNAYVVNNGNGTYNCVIYSSLTIYAPADCTNIFGIDTLKTLNLEGLNTGNTTTMTNMFMSTGHDMTIKGYCCVINTVQGQEVYKYEEGMTLVEFAALEGQEFETEEEANLYFKSIGINIVTSGDYDITLTMMSILFETEITTFNQLHSMLPSIIPNLAECTDANEEQCKASVEEIFGCVMAYKPDEFPLDSLTTLNISSFVINEGTDVTDMFAGLTSLKTLYAPAECHEEIALPATMYKEGTSTEYASLSNNTNSLILLDTANGTVSDEETTTPSTGFVDEQLLPALAIGLLSVVMFVITFDINKKKKYNR